MKQSNIPLLFGAKSIQTYGLLDCLLRYLRFCNSVNEVIILNLFCLSIEPK
nr:MAG TPA: hypothetical protein [Bacteriophage sp.]